MNHTIRPLGRPGDLGWVIKAHGEQYATEFGWDVSFEAQVAQIVADWARRPRSEARGGVDRRGRRGSESAASFASQRMSAQRVCASCWLSPRAEAADSAGVCFHLRRLRSAAGYDRMVLWTNDPLTAARYDLSGPPASSSSPRNRTTVTAWISSVRPTHWTSDRLPRDARSGDRADVSQVGSAAAAEDCQVGASSRSRR